MTRQKAKDFGLLLRASRISLKTERPMTSAFNHQKRGDVIEKIIRTIMRLALLFVSCFCILITVLSVINFIHMKDIRKNGDLADQSLVLIIVDVAQVSVSILIPLSFILGIICFCKFYKLTNKQT